MNTNNQEKTRRSAPFVVLALLLCLTVPMMAVSASAALFADSEALYDPTYGFQICEIAGNELDGDAVIFAQLSGEPGASSYYRFMNENAFVLFQNEQGFYLFVGRYISVQETSVLLADGWLYLMLGEPIIENGNGIVYFSIPFSSVAFVVGITDGLFPFMPEGALGYDLVYGGRTEYFIDESNGSVSLYKGQTWGEVGDVEVGLQVGVDALGELSTSLFTPSGALFPLSVTIGFGIALGVISWAVRKNKKFY